MFITHLLAIKERVLNVDEYVSNTIKPHLKVIDTRTNSLGKTSNYNLDLNQENYESFLCFLEIRWDSSKHDKDRIEYLMQHTDLTRKSLV